MIDRIKQLILDFRFVQDAFTEQCDAEVEIARKQERITAFSLAQKDILETMADDLDKKAEELAKEKLSKMLSPVDLNKIVTWDKVKGFVFIGNQRIEEGRLASLKSEAEYFLNSDLWAILYETPKELAQRAMFVSSEGLADLQKGKSILYTLSSQKGILDVFNSYVPKK